MIEKGIRGGVCHSINRFAKANNKYMKDYDKNKELIYLKYLDVNNLYGWVMSQKLLVNGFKWVEDLSEFDERSIKNYSEESDEGCFLVVDVQYPGKFHDILNDLPFLPEKIKIKKVEKLAACLHDKAKYVIHIENLKQTVNHGILLKEVHRMIKFSQKTWLNHISI